MGRLLRLLDGQGRIWALTAVIFGVALGVVVLGVVSVPTHAHPDRLAWWAVALLFYAAEAHVVHIHFRGDAHSFSLSEIPLVLGLFFLDPAALIAAHLVGAAAALGLHRRQSAHKLAFNLSQFLLSTAVAILVFAAAGGSAPLAARSWLAALLAALASGLIGVVAIVAVISVSQRRLALERLRLVLGLVAMGTVTNTSLGLLAARLLWNDVLGLWLLAVPAVTLLASYRAYVNERQRHEGLQFIYQSARMLHRSPEIDQSILAVLDHARDTFRAELAEITLRGGGGTRLLRCRVGPGGEVEPMATADPTPADGALAAAAREGAAVLVAQRQHGDLKDALLVRGFRDAMVVPLHADGKVVGRLLVANRLGEVTTFDSEDLHLFETLAHNVSVALENGQLERSLAQLRRLEEELKKQAFHDALTGLANRTLLVDRIDHALTRRGDRPVAVLFIDLDDFKTVNDSLGHAAGDQLLVAVAQRVRGCIRPSDTAGRLGGDEFAVVLDDAGGLGEAMRVAERILEALGTPFHLQETSVTVAASIGIAVGTPGQKAADDLVSDADVAMYTAKAQGKGTYEIFEPGMRAAVQRRHELKNELQRALSRDEFVVHYQPIVELSSGRITGVEALVRWQHPQRGLLLPGQFIPLAEETGLILAIGRRVLERACEDARRWRLRHPSMAPIAVGVNLSARQLEQPGFVNDVMDVLSRTGMPPASLVLEITESLLMQDTDVNVVKLQHLRRAGVRLAIDDFGTGYSSLSYLRHFPIDILKVAKPFVDELSTGMSTFADAIVSLGHSLGLELVAEGIEATEQRAALEAMGCHRGQGFLFSPAVDAAAAERLLTRGLGPEPIMAMAQA